MMGRIGDMSRMGHNGGAGVLFIGPMASRVSHASGGTMI